MILETGTQTPTPAQRRLVRQIADDSFTRRLPHDFGCVPCGRNWKHDATTGIALRLRYVEPHEDDWVGAGKHPRRYAAVFWLVDMPKFEDLILQVGTVAHRMRPGDFVVFRDSVLHSVFAKRVWRGCAYQVRPNDRAEPPQGAAQEQR
jgi:hypothetical protein